LAQVGYPLKDAQTLEKERMIAEVKKKRGHDVYYVKGEILYKFGKIFKAWTDNVQKVQDTAYKLIEKAEVLAQHGYRDVDFEVTSELEEHLTNMTKASDDLFSKFSEKWRTLRNEQAVKSIVASPVYGKQVGQ